MTDLWLVAGAFALVAAAPGPANLAAATTAMARGLRAGTAMAAGLSLGLALWGVVAAVGLGAVLTAAPAAQIGLRLAGGAYLIWLGVRALISARSPGGGPAPLSAAPPFRAGLVLNLLNPKAVVAWMAVLSVAEGGASLWPAVALCAAIGVANYLAWTAAFSRAPMMRAYTRWRRMVDAASGAIFAALGLGLIRQAVRP